MGSTDINLIKNAEVERCYFLVQYMLFSIRQAWNTKYFIEMGYSIPNWSDLD